MWETGICYARIVGNAKFEFSAQIAPILCSHIVPIKHFFRGRATGFYRTVYCEMEHFWQ